MPNFSASNWRPHMGWGQVEAVDLASGKSQAAMEQEMSLHLAVLSPSLDAWTLKKGATERRHILSANGNGKSPMNGVVCVFSPGKSLVLHGPFSIAMFDLP